MRPDTSGENAGTSEQPLPGADGTEICAHRSAKVARIASRHVGVVNYWQIAKLEGRTMQRFALTRHTMLADACRPHSRWDAGSDGNRAGQRESLGCNTCSSVGHRHPFR